MPIIQTEGGFIYKKTRKNAGFGKAKFLLILFLCGVMISVGCFCIFTKFDITSVLSLNKYLIYDAKTYYAVYVQKADDYRSVSSFAQDIKISDGAGYVLNFNNNYYVIASCYSSMEDAKSVAEKISNFDADVLEIKFDRLIISLELTNEQIRVLKHSTALVNTAFENLYNIVLSLDRGEIMDAEARQKLQVFKEICLEDKETFNKAFQNNLETVITRVKIFQSEVISNISMLLISQNLSSDIKYSIASILDSFSLLQKNIRK
ncbi:MAG TPA: hypothetical protein DCO89_02390 [Clostridiales bacterium]|nr:hypothetical protein [Clostridiales bacterium]